MQDRLVAAAVAFLGLSGAWAQTQSTTNSGTGSGSAKCGAGSLCPADAPCCSQYGDCGVGAFCLGGCDPLFSHTLDSCVPAPVCSSKNYQFTSLDGITDQGKYLGDASKSDWVSSGTPLEAPTNDAVILTLAKDGESQSGTLLASTHYVWYGKISATMKTSRGQGVVSAFILLADSKDEIDFEFIGTDLKTAQSNFYFQGITNYDQGKNLSVSSGGDTFSAYHTYTIDWQPDQTTWSVDGTLLRTLKKSDTFNKTDNQYHYPQTPARVQLSLWPAGLEKNGKGTVDWAGGLINWNAPDPAANKYYYSMYQNVSVQCYDPPQGVSKSGSTSYVFTDNKGVQSSVAITGNNTVLKSLLGTGVDMDKDYPAKASGTKSASSATASATVVNTIPGLTGGGPGTDGTRGDSGSGGSSGGSAASSASGSSQTGVGTFSQGDSGSSSKGTGSGAVKDKDVLMGSMFAALMAFVGMVILM